MGYMNEFPHSRMFDSDLREILELFNEVKYLPEKLDELLSKGKISFNHVTPQMFGAKADGITSDTEAIRRALDNGAVFFPKGVYAVEFTDILTQYYSLFNLKSNTNLIFEPGAIIKVIGAKPAFRSALFGVADRDLPVANIRVYGGTFIGEGDIGCFRFNTNKTGDKLISNIEIVNCEFHNFGSAAYIVQERTEPTETRHTHNVLIANCRAFECWGSFVTADCKHITIRDCYADGNNKNAYDAISVHCGIDVEIKDNYFKNYNLGQVINIRNSIENLCGTKNVIVSGNIIENCPIKAISVALSEENTYGVENIIITNNIIKNCLVGVFASCGSGIAGTPFRNVVVNDNNIHATSWGVQITNNINVMLKESIICGNNISGETRGINLEAIRECSITGNKVRVANSDNSKTLLIEYIYYSDFNGNYIWCDNYQDYVMRVSNCNTFNISGNFIRAKIEFRNNQNTVISNNNLLLLCNNNDRSFTANDVEFNGRITRETSGAPSSGTWRKGDRFFNNFATTTTCLGWVCVESGTPGTWKEFGAIV